MRRKEIPKRSGGVRVVFCPSAHERKVLRAQLKTLATHNSTTLPYAHGFMAERSPLTAAKQHVGFDVTINLDLKDFFPSVKPEMVRGLVPKTLDPLCWAGDGCGQGLPTAPALANLAAKSMDEAVVKYCKKQEKATGVRFAYTRYADDLSVSFSPDPGQEKIDAVKAMLTEIVRRCGFKPNPSKWRVQRAVGGRREIVGLLVGGPDQPIRPVRKWRRQHRAVVHRIAMMERGFRPRPVEIEIGRLRMTVSGRMQWLEPKMPLSASEKTARLAMMADGRQLAEANKFCDKMHYQPMPQVRKLIPGTSTTLPGGAIARITNDPVYFIGISDFVTRAQRSASCLRLGLVWNTGTAMYSGAGAWWWRLAGCSIAQIVDPKQPVSALDVTRPAQLARVLVFKMRDGKLYRQARCYCESDHWRIKLISYLDSLGIHEVPRSGGGALKVSGGVVRDSKVKMPYLDCGMMHHETKNGKQHDTVCF